MSDHTTREVLPSIVTPGSSIRTYVPVGCLGYGVIERSLRAALAERPHVIAVDAGSSDPGPYYLGAGESYTSRMMVRRDLELLLPAAIELGAPLIIGSAGGAGGAPHVTWTLEILSEVAAAQDLHPKVAVIDAELDADYLCEKLAAGDILDFEAGRELTADHIRSCRRIVAQMGPEPIVRALSEGADVVLAGRAYDAALAAAYPIMRGVDPGTALHLGIADCGLQVVIPPTTDGVLTEAFADRFLIVPADPDRTCSVQAVSTMTMYENADPYRLSMPGGVLDVTGAEFTAVDERTVSVSGGRFHRGASYFVKLEGAALVGFRTVCIAATRDPLMIERLDEVLDTVRTRVSASRDPSAEPYELLFRIYGRDGVMGTLEPDRYNVPHEVGVLIEAVSTTAEAAREICAFARSTLLHADYDGRKTTAGNLAFPFSPAELPPQEVYEFRVYDLLRLDDPCEPFQQRWVQL